MLIPRIIPCLLLKGKGFVKTIQFKNPIYLGDPLNTIRIFNRKMVDEIIILDINATRESKSPNFELLKRISSVCFSPLTYGGGVNNLEDAENLFSIGIEKLSLNTAAIKNQSIISEMAKRFGIQSVVVSVNIFRDSRGKNQIVDNDLNIIHKDDSILDHLKKVEDMGAGEILINDVNRDGTMKGYDVNLIRSLTTNLSVPVIACGGCGNFGHMKEVIIDGGASAAAAGSIFVFNGPHKAVLISYPDRQTIRNLIK